MASGRHFRISLAFALALTACVTASAYAVALHTLRVRPGLLIVQVGWVAQWAAPAVAVSVRRHNRVIAEAIVDEDSRVVIVPDLPGGTYQVSIMMLDTTMTQKTVTIGDVTARWVQPVPLPLPPPPPPSDTFRRDMRPWRSDSTDRVVARQVYALVVAHLTAEFGSPALVVRETAHTGYERTAAHGMAKLSESIHRRLREPPFRQLVWHHVGVFPSTVTVINRSDVPTDLEGFRRWRSRLGLTAEQRLPILSLSRVFVSDDGTQALVFGHVRGSRGDMFWLTRPARSAPWRIERVEMLWIS